MDVRETGLELSDNPPFPFTLAFPGVLGSEGSPEAFPLAWSYLFSLSAPLSKYQSFQCSAVLVTLSSPGFDGLNYASGFQSHLESLKSVFLVPSPLSNV